VLAQEAAIAALGEAEEVSRRAKLTVAERERVRSALLDAGYDVPPSQGNFVWLVLGERATAFAQACMDGGVIVRPFAGEGVRVTIGAEADNDRLLELARAFAKN
jgi:histidinol-phosphate aminotransferase